LSAADAEAAQTSSADVATQTKRDNLPGHQAERNNLTPTPLKQKFTQAESIRKRNNDIGRR
jgi:hypothetical protein